jgi:hypothetical protein
MDDVHGGQEARFPSGAGLGFGKVDMRSPWKGGKHRSGKATWGRRVSGMKGVNKLLGVSKVSSWFPAIVTEVIAFPFDKVLVLVTILTTIQDVFDFVFKFIFNLDWLWGWWSVTIDFIAMSGRKAINVKDRVLAHEWRKAESIGEVTSTFEDFIWAQLSWG